MLIVSDTNFMNSTIFTTPECSNFQLDDLSLIISILLIFTAIFSSSTCLLLITVVFKSSLFHINIRILLINAFMAAFINVLAQSIVACYNIIFYSNSCNSPISRLYCFWLTWLLVPSSRLFMEFLGALTFEHYLISFRPKILSQKAAGFLTTILIAGIYALNFGFMVKSYLGVIKMNGQPLAYCNSFFTVDSSAQSSDVLVYSLVQIVLLVLFCLIYRSNINKYATDFTINTAKHNLQERFTNWSNIKTMSDLLPFLLYQTSIAILVNICHITLLATNWSRILDSRTVNILMVMNFTRTVNFFLSFFIWLRKNETLKKSFKKMICSNQKATTIENVDKEGKFEVRRRFTMKNNIVVPYRLDPQVADDVLKNIWAEKTIVNKKSSN